MRTTPTLEEWKRLFIAAEALRTAGLWRFVTSEDVFAVEDPESGELGFVVADESLGGLGPGFMLLLSAAALDVLDSMHWHFYLSQTDLRLRQDALVVDFVKPDELAEPARAALEQLGLTFPEGKVAACGRYAPGMFPQGIDGVEARRLAIALEQALVVLPRLEEDDDALESDERMLVRVSDGGASDDGPWRDEWRAIEEVTAIEPPQELAPLPEWSQLADRFPMSKRTWEYAVMYAPVPVDIESGPELACIHMIVDATGRTLREEVGRRRDPLGLCVFLIEAIETAGRRPRTILVADSELRNAIAGLAAQIGIELDPVDHLPMVGPEYASVQMFGGA